MKTAYTNGKILNGHEDMTPVTGLAVLVDGETITGIIPDGEVSAEYTVVDLRGGYLMPGLINLHVHIPGSGKPAKKQADTKKLVKLITALSSAARRWAFTAPWCAGCCFRWGTPCSAGPCWSLWGRTARPSRPLGWTVTCGGGPGNPERSHGLSGAGRGELPPCQRRDYERLSAEYCSGPIFILPWGLNMGASGAGLATFLSNCAACVYFFILLYCRRGKTFVCLQPSMLKADWTALKEICGVGVPASIQNLLNVTGMTVLNNFTSSFGPDTVAAMGIAQKINMIPLYITLGFSQGVMPLISYSYSGKHYRRMRDIILFSVKLSVGFMTVVSLGYYLGSDQLIFLFMKNETIIQYGGSFLQSLCLALPFLCLDFLAVGVFQACGLGRKALAFAILRKIVLEIPALFLLNPMYGLAYAQLSAELVLFSAAVITVTRLMNRMEKIDK